MHEYGITERLFHVAMDQAQLQDGERLQRLYVTLDPQSGYVPDAIRFYFEQLAAGTAADGAELLFELVEQSQHIRLTTLDITENIPTENIPSDDIARITNDGEVGKKSNPDVRWRICVDGTVQEVDFYNFVYNLATELHLRGWVRNTPNGVEIEVQGPEVELHHFRHHLENDAPLQARVLAITVEPCSQ